MHRDNFKRYLVWLQPRPPLRFEVWAENEKKALEQTARAYPDSAVTSITEEPEMS